MNIGVLRPLGITLPEIFLSLEKAMRKNCALVLGAPAASAGSGTWRYLAFRARAGKRDPGEGPGAERGWGGGEEGAGGGGLGPDTLVGGGRSSRRLWGAGGD